MRNPTFDIVKGIGIMAVVVGHSAAPLLAKDFIFIWHMPLFFLVSGYFFRIKPFGEALRNNVRGLLVPYLVTATLLFLLAACLSVAKGSPDGVFNAFVGIFVGAGSHGLPNFGDYNVGAIWFLLSMFWCRMLYNALAQRLSVKYLGGGDSYPLYFNGLCGSGCLRPHRLASGRGCHALFLHRPLGWQCAAGR